MGGQCQAMERRSMGMEYPCSLVNQLRGGLVLRSGYLTQPKLLDCFGGGVGRKDRPRALPPPLLVIVAVVVPGEGEQASPRLLRQGVIVGVQRRDEVTGCVPGGQLCAAPWDPPSRRSGPIDLPSTQRSCLRPAATHLSEAPRLFYHKAPDHMMLRSHHGLVRAVCPPRPADPAVAPTPGNWAQPWWPIGQRLSWSRRAVGIDGCQRVNYHRMGCYDGRMAW